MFPLWRFYGCCEVVGIISMSFIMGLLRLLQECYHYHGYDDDFSLMSVDADVNSHKNSFYEDMNSGDIFHTKSMTV